MAQPWFNFAKGLTGDYKSMTKGLLGMFTEVAFIGSIIGGGVLGVMKIILFLTDTVGEKVDSAVDWLEDYSGISDKELSERWTKYWSYKDPKVLLSNNTKESVYQDGRNSNIKPGNAPTYIRLGKTNNLKLEFKMNIGGTETDTIQFKLSKSYILGGNETFSPDVISLPSQAPVNTNYINLLDDKDGKIGFKSWLKTEYYKNPNGFTSNDEAVMVQDKMNTNIYYYTPWDKIKKEDMDKLTFEYKDGKFQEKK